MRDVEASVAELHRIWRSGPSMHKMPDDLRRYEAIIDRVKPNVVVETGLYYGGSQIWFAKRVPHVINVEINGETTDDYVANKHGLGLVPLNATIVHGHSHTVYPAVEKMVRDLGGPVLVVLDSDHGTENVFGEMRLYSQLVTVGSYMVVEDGILHFVPKGPWPKGNWFDGDPFLAVERWLPNHQEFEIDSELEDAFPTTQSPSGYLRRIR